MKKLKLNRESKRKERMLYKQLLYSKSATQQAMSRIVEAGHIKNNALRHFDRLITIRKEFKHPKTNEAFQYRYI